MKESKQDSKDRGEKFAKYGWKLSEDNLATLPDDAPAGAHNLAEWLTLNSRRSSLVEWLDHVKDDGRIHGRFTHIGAWTGRMAHSNPNQANIPSEFHGKAETAVAKVKEKYDGQFRGLWSVPKGSYLVGTDAAGIQLRILAHLMKSDQYVNAITSGRKEDGTDIHNLNRRALGLEHVTRDISKTYIYAYLLGAGTQKIAEILRIPPKSVKPILDRFQDRIEGLDNLKRNGIPYVARRGWFHGLDGRRVKVPSEHKTLAGMLQNGESVVMKHAALDWVSKAKAEKMDFKLVTWPHDEWQTEVNGSLDQAEHLAFLQRQSIKEAGERLNVYCPLEGESAIGSSWQETH